MGIGITNNNFVPLQGSSWEDLFGIDVDGLTSITRANFGVLLLGNDQFTVAECWYTGAGDITLSELANLPLGSVIHVSKQAAGTPSTPYIAYKVAAAGTSTWKYQAVNT